MTTTDGFEWIQGDPLFHTSLYAVAEGIDGTGILSPGDLMVSSTANANEIQVSTGDLWYSGDTSVYTVGSPQTHTLSDNTSGDDRWDLVVFDTSIPGTAIKQGTPDPSPEPPLPSGSEVVLAYVYLADGQTNVTDTEIKNWRTPSSDAGDIRLSDTAGDYTSTTVEGAFTEVVRQAGDPLNGPLDLSSFSGTSVLDFGTNPGVFGPVLNGTIDSNSSAGTPHSYNFAVNTTPVMRFYAESDGSGGIQNPSIRLGTNLQSTTGTSIFDAVNQEIPRGTLDTEKLSTTVTSSSYSTSGEEIVYVDTAAIGSSSTITLSTADVSTGNIVAIVDISGSASTNSISIDTGGGESIDGGTSTTLDSDYGILRLVSDGSNWIQAGGITSVGTSDIQNSAVTTAKIADDNVTRSKLETGIITDDYVSSFTTISRSVLEVDRFTETISSNGQTGSEEIMFIDTSSNSVQLQLDDFQTRSGKPLAVIDSKGNASNNNITLVTESSQTIDGNSSVTIDTDYGNVMLFSDGNNWFSVGNIGSGGGGGLTVSDIQNTFTGQQSGDVANGTEGVVAVDAVPDGEAVQVFKAGLLNADGTAVASGVDLTIATLDNSGGKTTQATAISGDGTTVYDSVEGVPVSSYTNSTGSEQTVAILVENSSGSTVTIAANARGQIN